MDEVNPEVNDIKSFIMNRGTKSCCVIDCRNRRTREKGNHFFRFPPEQPYRDLWINFSRRGSDFVVKKHSKICQDHFKSSCLVYKKKVVLLANHSVPTIFYRETPKGTEKIVLKLDPDLMHYINAESLLNPAYDKERNENELMEKQKMRKAEIKKSCRFCFEDPIEDEKNFVDIDKLKSYTIKIDSVFTLIGLSTKHNNQFSKVMCEECFQQIVLFDGYKKRCMKAQDRVIEELKELELNLQKLQGGTVDPELWDKPQPSWDDDNNDDEDDDKHNISISTISSAIKSELITITEPSFQKVLIKEELVFPMSDDDCEDFHAPSFGMDSDDGSMNEPLVPAATKAPAKVSVTASFSDDKNVVKTEEAVTLEPTPTDIKMPADDSDDDYFGSSNAQNLSCKADDSKSVPSKDEDELITEVRKPGRNSKPFRVYECFFCRLVSSDLSFKFIQILIFLHSQKLPGKKLLQNHDCQKKQVVCPFEGCGKLFITMNGFNVHITNLHKLPKLSRLFCSVCMLSMISTEQEYKEHRRMCEKTSDSKFNKQSVACELCNKVCPNLQSFNIHMMFHKPDDVKKSKKKYEGQKGEFVCDQCGKTFIYGRYLAKHKKQTHRLVLGLFISPRSTFFCLSEHLNWTTIKIA